MVTEIVTVKLDPEQMEYIQKTYLDVIERVIQERKEIKSTLDTVLEHAAHAWRIYQELMPERFEPGVIMIVDDGWPPIVEGAQPGQLVYHLVAMIEYTKQLYDSIQIEGEPDDNPHP